MTRLLRLEELASRATAPLDRYPLVALSGPIILLGAAAVSMAAAKPLWHDEIYTVLLARLRLADLWTANLSGVDLSAPLNTLATHYVMSFAGGGHVAVRLAPLVGFLVSVGLVFAFVRRRSNAVAAAAAALLSGFTAAYRYAYEARGYGLMMAFAALSLFAWSEAAAGRRRMLYVPLLALSLAAGYWAHFYAVFAAAPVIAGELQRTRRTRKIDKPVWVAVGISLLALLPLVPLLRAGASLAPSFWGRATFGEIRPTYGFLLNALAEAPFVAGVTLLVLAAVFLRRRLPHRQALSLAPHESVALATAVLLPVLQILTAILTTGVFVQRYSLIAVPGLCMVAGLVLAWLAQSKLLQAAVVAVLAIGFAMPAAFRPSFVNPARQRPALMKLLTRERPVLVTGGLMYLQLWYYTPEAMQDHLQYIAHLQAARHWTGSDSIDRGLLGLAKWAPLKVVEPRPFVTAYPEFHVYGAGSGWLLYWLEEGKAHVEKLGEESGAAILWVRTAF